MSRWRKDPLEVCGGKHANATLEYHECVCKFDYRPQAKFHYIQAQKFKHCLLADEMRRIDNFQLYVIIAVVVGVVLIFGVAAFCSCKWYLQTNDNPCGCFPCCSCKKKKKKKKKSLNSEDESPHNLGIENGSQAWTPIRLVPNKDAVDCRSQPRQVTNEMSSDDSPGFCMKFCLSDPVQDCCEFFDCDIMWRKKNIYTIPIFGRRKQPPLQRRPTRPAPPPPKPSVSVPPIVKYPEPFHIGYDGEVECEPVPEAPPSPEPVRIEQPRAMYVDPLAFLQRPFLKPTKDKVMEEEPEALYNKMKGFVFGKAKKSSSVASLNIVGVSNNPDAVSNTSSKKSKYSRTGSLASLHNLSDEQLDSSYHNKRSMSLASLHVAEESPKKMAPKGLFSKFSIGRSKGSLHNICEDDVPPSLRTDEYIDLEEMSKRIEAKMQAAQNGTLGNDISRNPVISASVGPSSTQSAATGSDSWTPNFVPASAYDGSPKTRGTVSSFSPKSQQSTSQGSQQGIPSYNDSLYRSQHSYSFDEDIHVGENAGRNYFPPVPATTERPAVPARIAIGTPISGTGTLGRPKPVVPPRPPGSGSNSPKPRAPQPPSSGRPSPVVKPSAPPPPPPVITPIESSL
ncbi:hypothetical protein OTU49_007041 [Cherax quadricarinatus]|uniref:Uncharacterized protein n=2 Tax=Cherax quadricarinatus TaxID=27406 RepID=A0AAW0WJQ0_CHEQU